MNEPLTPPMLLSLFLGYAVGSLLGLIVLAVIFRKL